MQEEVWPSNILVEDLPKQGAPIVANVHAYPGPPNVRLLRALWSLVVVGIWGILKGSWGVLDLLD